MSYRGLRILTLTTALFGLALTKGMTQQEVGKVKWGRDIDTALANSKKSGKPVFLLFQEVPG